MAGKNDRFAGGYDEKFEKLYGVVMKLLAKTEEIKNETRETAAFVREAVKK